MKGQRPFRRQALEGLTLGQYQLLGDASFEPTKIDGNLEHHAKRLKSFGYCRVVKVATPLGEQGVRYMVRITKQGREAFARMTAAWDVKRARKAVKLGVVSHE